MKKTKKNNGRGRRDSVSDVLGEKEEATDLRVAYACKKNKNPIDVDNNSRTLHALLSGTVIHFGGRKS